MRLRRGYVFAPVIPLMAAAFLLSGANCAGTQDTTDIEDVIRLEDASVRTERAYEDDGWLLEVNAKTVLLNFVPLELTNLLYFPTVDGKRLVCWAIVLNNQWTWMPPAADNGELACRQKFQPDDVDAPLKMAPDELMVPLESSDCDCPCGD